MPTDHDVQTYLSEHPGATVTEVAFALSITVTEARRHMKAASPSETVSERPTKPKRTRTWVAADQGVSVDPGGPGADAKWLAGLFRSQQVMDVHRAAAYLGIAKVSVDAAVAHRRLSCVQLNHKKLFTKSDLDRYRKLRGIGKGSRLAKEQVYEV